MKDIELLIDRLLAYAAAHEYYSHTDDEERQLMNDLYDAADALERAPRWRDVAEELPHEAQEVLLFRAGKVVSGAWIGGIFWYNNQKVAAAYWMPMPPPPAKAEKSLDTLTPAP